MLNENQRRLIIDAQKILVIQAENPDGDSLGSALALEEIFSDLEKNVILYCPVQIPTYLRHIDGWDRISPEFPTNADLAIIVDTSSKILLSKTLDDSAAKKWLETHEVLVFDHHVSVTPDLPFDAQYIVSDSAVATGEMIFDIAIAENWAINDRAATNLFISIQADSLGLTTQATTAKSFAVCGKLVELGADPAKIEEKRRDFMKKKPEILKYKGELIERIEYFNDGRTALIFVPFDEIQKYSNDYNPTMLVLDEMRMVRGVDVAIGVKTYPDGKLTGKLRTNIPISDQISGFFGGGGHPFAAGFRIYENYETWLPEFAAMMEKVYAEFDRENPERVHKIIEEKVTPNVFVKNKNNKSNLGGFRVKEDK